jgi:membrane-associated phospholipid phosphatase
MLEFLQWVDRELFFLINRGMACAWLDPVMLGLSWMGAWTIVLVAFALLSHCRPRLFWAHAMVMAIGLLPPVVVSLELKSGVRRPRPVRELNEMTPWETREVRRIDDLVLSGKSFPSGHSLFAFYVMTYVWCHRRKLRLWPFLLAGLASISRVYVGSHFVFDVLVGALLGLAGGWLAWRFSKPLLGLAERPRGPPLAAADVQVLDDGSRLDRRHVVLLLLAAAAWYLPGVFSPRDFWVADEARYAEVLREMLESGQWLVMHLNGHFYPDKPPLYFWLCALVSLAAGITPAACMIVTWLSAVGCILATYWLGCMVFGRRSALFGALALISTLVVFLCAQMVRMDILMAFFVVLALALFYRGTHQPAPGRHDYVWFHCCSGLAMLSKGPLGMAFTLVPAVAYLAWRRQWQALARLLAPWKLLLAFAVPGAWLLAAWLTGHGDLVRNIFGEQIVGRSTQGAIHDEPFYFYLVLLPVLLLPWWPFLFRAVRGAWRSHRGAAALLLLWAGCGLGVISLVSGKLFIYVLPIVPPLALLLGHGLAAWLDEPARAGAVFRREAVTATALTCGIPAAVAFVTPHVPATRGLDTAVFGVVFVPLLLLGLWFALRRAVRLTLALLFFGFWLFSVLGAQVLAPEIDSWASARGIARAIRRHAEAGRGIATAGIMRGTLNFYAGLEIPEVHGTEIARHLRYPDNVLVTRARRYRKWPAAMTRRFRILESFDLLGESYIIVGRDPVAE